jgi:GxxExxY protein
MVIDKNVNELSRKIIGACIEVHKILGPGLLESTYLECVCRELEMRGISFNREMPIPIEYKGSILEMAYRADLVVEIEIIVELKAVKEMVPIYQAQLLTYLKLSGKKLGLLINFNVPLLKDGITRIINPGNNETNRIHDIP